MSEREDDPYEGQLANFLVEDVDPLSISGPYRIMAHSAINFNFRPVDEMLADIGHVIGSAMTEQNWQDIRAIKAHAREHWAEPAHNAAWWVQENIQEPLDRLAGNIELPDIEWGCDPEKGGAYAWCNKQSGPFTRPNR